MVPANHTLLVDASPKWSAGCFFPTGLKRIAALAPATAFPYDFTADWEGIYGAPFLPSAGAIFVRGTLVDHTGGVTFDLGFAPPWTGRLATV